MCSLTPGWKDFFLKLAKRVLKSRYYNSRDITNHTLSHYHIAYSALPVVRKPWLIIDHLLHCARILLEAAEHPARETSEGALPLLRHLAKMKRGCIQRGLYDSTATPWRYPREISAFSHDHRGRGSGENRDPSIGFPPHCDNAPTI
jgi:hypothetical protein